MTSDLVQVMSAPHITVLHSWSYPKAAIIRTNIHMEPPKMVNHEHHSSPAIVNLLPLTNLYICLYMLGKRWNVHWNWRSTNYHCPTCQVSCILHEIHAFSTELTLTRMDVEYLMCRHRLGNYYICAAHASALHNLTIDKRADPHVTIRIMLYMYA